MERFPNKKKQGRETEREKNPRFCRNNPFNAEKKIDCEREIERGRL